MARSQEREVLERQEDKREEERGETDKRDCKSEKREDSNGRITER
jgi:hypothetical protein